MENHTCQKSTITISQKTPWALVLIAASFIILTALAHLIFGAKTSSLMGFNQLVDVDSEANLPTWYSASLLHFAALLAWMISTKDAIANRLNWKVIAFLLLAMGIDEIASLHNAPSRRLGELLGVQSGIMMNAWVIPGALVCLAVALSFIKFLTRQPRWLALGFILAAGLYLFGAIVLEIASTYVEFETAGFDYDGDEHYSLAFEMLAVAEEVFEYAGVILTIALLMRRGRELDAEITFNV